MIYNVTEILLKVRGRVNRYAVAFFVKYGESQKQMMSRGLT
jgi:hypothetical protein